MTKKLKEIKHRKPKKTFLQKLAEKLKVFGEVDEGAFSDKSGSWVGVRMGMEYISFSFDMKGEHLDRIIITRDIIGVIDTKTILNFTEPNHKSNDKETNIRS